MISLKNVSLAFSGKHVLKNFNLEISEGDKILLDAPSGSGKSTLMKVILGFQQVDGGDVHYQDQEITSYTIGNLRKDIAYVSQDVELQDMKVKDLILEIFSYRGNAGKSYQVKDLENLFTQFRLEKKLLDEKTSSLSGGERQRLGLVIALLLDRKILLLDEVTSGLENDLKEEVVQYIMGLNKTVIIISHDMIWREIKDIRVVSW